MGDDNKICIERLVEKAYEEPSNLETKLENIDPDEQEVEDPLNVSDGNKVDGSQIQGSQAQLSKKKWWTRHETVALINAVHSHYDEFKFQKKNMWKNVCNDLHALNIMVSIKECMIKWKNMLRTYYSVKHNREKTGRETFKFKYYHEIDNIVGNKLTSKSTLVRKSKLDAQRRVGLQTELFKMKQEEWIKRQKEWATRHEERQEKMLLQKQKLEMETRKVELLELYIRIKEKEKS